MKYKIKRATSSYANAISEIEQTCFTLPRSYGIIERQLNDKNNLFLIAVDDKDRVLGYCDLAFILDEGYIDNVAVSPSFRYKGIGDALIEKLVNEKQTELSFLTLEVRASNTAAINLYKKHGFSMEGIQKNHYEQPHEDAILMTLFFHNTEVNQ